MFYYLSIILLPFMMANGERVSEKSMTGPFDTKAGCEEYKVSVENIITLNPAYEIVESLCKQKLPKPLI